MHACSEGGFFNARLTFPKDYPNSPPTCRFTSEMWHPNGKYQGLHAYSKAPCLMCCTEAMLAVFCAACAVFPDGRVCISILHHPGDDPHGYETAAERWSPVQSVSRSSSWGAVAQHTWQTGGVRKDHAWLCDVPVKTAACKRAPHSVHRSVGGGLEVAHCYMLLQVETIMISIISMLSSPNDESPANVDAAKEWREDKEGFKKKVGRIVRKSQEML